MAFYPYNYVMYRPAYGKGRRWMPAVVIDAGARLTRIAKFANDTTVHQATVQTCNLRHPANVELNAYDDEFTEIHRGA